MKKNRKELEEKISFIINKYINQRRKIKKQLINKLAENNISAGKAVGIWNKNISCNTLFIAELYLFLKALFDITKEHSLMPNEWFNEEEETIYSLYKPEIFL